MAHAVVTYAMSTADVNGGKGRPASPPGQHVEGMPVGVGTTVAVACTTTTTTAAPLLRRR